MVKLQLPGETAANDPDTIPRILGDEVLYDNVEPWANLAAGESLHRTNPFANGNASDSWQSATPTPGRFDTVVLGDFTQDGLVDASDVNALCKGVRDEDMTFDLTRDGEINLADFDFLMKSILRTSIADVNLDGIFDGLDLTMVLTAGEFEDALAENSIWSTGDWNCDGDFTTGDLVRAFIAGDFGAAARAVNLAEIASAIGNMQRPTQSISSVKLDPVEQSSAASKRAALLKNGERQVRSQLVDSVFSEPSDRSLKSKPSSEEDSSEGTQPALAGEDLGSVWASEL